MRTFEPDHPDQDTFADFTEEESEDEEEDEYEITEEEKRRFEEEVECGMMHDGSDPFEYDV